jgi:hypothetical protein
MLKHGVERALLTEGEFSSSMEESKEGRRQI